MAKSQTAKYWIARLLVVLVFAINMYCAVSFFINPAAYTNAYQLEGAGAQAAIAGFGVAFAMWNATYVPVMVFPQRFRALFGVVLAQQLIGIVGESWIYASLGIQAALLASSIMRFIIFDTIGLALLVVAFVLSRP